MNEDDIIVDFWSSLENDVDALLITIFRFSIVYGLN